MYTPMLMNKGMKPLWHEAGHVRSVRRRRPRRQLWMEAAEKAATSRPTNLECSWMMPSVLYHMMMEMQMTITAILLLPAITVMINANMIPYLVVLTSRTFMGANTASGGRAARLPKPQPPGAEMKMVITIVNGGPIDYFLRTRIIYRRETPSAPRTVMPIIISINWYISRCRVVRPMTSLLTPTMMRAFVAAYVETIDLYMQMDSTIIGANRMRSPGPSSRAPRCRRGAGCDRRRK